jgi:molecular chaperone GrpE
MVQESIEEIKKRADGLESQYNKLKQEFKDYIENSRKNEDKRRQEIKTDFSKRLLVVADSLNRIAGLNNDATCEIVKNYSSNIRTNIEVIYNQMLSASGLIAIEPAKGDKFDEQKHMAVGVEYGTTYPDNTIYSVIRKGYIHENNLVRPAEVIVMKNSTEQKVIRISMLDRLLRWFKPAKFQFTEINQKLDERERLHKARLEKITLDIESLRNTVHELDAKAKQRDEFERIHKERLEKIALDMDILINKINELGVNAKQTNASERIHKEKIPWI